MITQTILHRVRWALTVCFAFLLSSCYETKQDFTINPDGSGKVKHECTFQNVNLGNENDTSQEALQAAIARVIKDSKASMLGAT